MVTSADVGTEVISFTDKLQAPRVLSRSAAYTKKERVVFGGDEAKAALLV